LFIYSLTKDLKIMSSSLIPLYDDL